MSANEDASARFWNKTMVLYAEIECFCIKTKDPIHQPEKVWVFPTLENDMSSNP